MWRSDRWGICRLTVFYFPMRILQKKKTFSFLHGFLYALKVCGRCALRQAERRMTCWSCLSWVKRGECCLCSIADNYTASSQCRYLIRVVFSPESWCWVVRRWRRLSFQALWTISRLFIVATWHINNSFKFVYTHLYICFKYVTHLL